MIEDDVAAQLDHIRAQLRDHSNYIRAAENERLLARLTDGENPRRVQIGPEPGPRPRFAAGSPSDTLGNTRPFIGQTNLLVDPVLDSTPNGLTLTTSKQTSGAWAGHYVLNSGTAHVVQAAYRKYDRGDFANNPFTSGAGGFSLTPSGVGATDMTIYVYPDADLAPTALSALDWLVTGIKMFRTAAVATNVTTFNATLEIVEGSSVVASSVTHDFLTDATYTVFPLTASWTDTLANFQANTWRWRLNTHVVMSAAGVGNVQFRWGEPQLHFAYTPDLLPFAPQIAGWVPSSLSSSVFLSGILAPSALSSSQNDYDPGIDGYGVLQVTATGAIDITGLARGGPGRLLLVTNVGNVNSITLKHQSASSVTANRLNLPNNADVVLTPYSGRFLWYNATVSRWQVIG